MGKENLSKTTHSSVGNDSRPPIRPEDLATDPRYSIDKEAGLPTCRVCQCVESDRRGDAALGFLGITAPAHEIIESNASESAGSREVPEDDESNFRNKGNGRESEFVEIISPEGEVFICNADIEMGAWQNRDALVELGCSCKNDLALVHYACALKWFVSHGSTVCEICGHVAKNIRVDDFRKVVVSLKDYEELRERTAGGDPNPVLLIRNSGVDPDAVAAIRRQRLSEIALWFGPPNNTSVNNNNSLEASQVVSERPLSTVNEARTNAESRVTRWAVEGTGILLATGLLTVTLAWLIAPRVGKDTAKSGLHILLGGLCALTVVIFFRFVVLTRIRYGPARYWAILFIFWFLVFGIWASRTHSANAT